MHSNGKILFLDKKLFIKVSMMRRSRLVLFLQGKSLCFGTRRLAKCSLSEGPRWNTNHSFKQYNALLSTKGLFAALVKLFFLQGKVCVLPCVGKSLARCLSFEAFRRPCRKNDISAFIWHKPFIQTVKCSSFNQRIVYQILWRAAHVK